MKISVTGDKELLTKLSKLRKTQAAKAIRKGSRAGSKVVQAKEKEDAPEITGALKREIKVRALKRSRRWTGTQVTMRVAGGVPYGSFVDQGTKRMKARHFVKRAVEEAKDAAGREFVDGIASEIAKL